MRNTGKASIINKKTLKRAVILGSIAGIFILFIIFKKEIQILSKKAFEIYGFFGIAGITFLMDIFIQPLSPDLLILSSTIGGANILFTSTAGGISSVCAGATGYIIGSRLLKRGFFPAASENIKKGERLFKRYGHWAVVIGALTPIPYSAVCWSAGLYEMGFKKFILASLLARIPRFFIVALIGSHFAG